MRKTITGALAIAMLVSTSGTAMAQALTWRVSEAAGAVTIQHGGVSRPATRGATLAEGDVVQTAGGGRAVLVHDRDFVTVAPNSRVSVPEAAQASGLTKLIQTIGNAVYKIEKLGVPHFGVSTPYLAAVVKGTTFSVTVDASSSSLQVVEGAVEVATLDGGARDLIRPGAVASIAASDLYRLRVQGDSDRTIDSPGRPASSAPAPAPAPMQAPAASAPAQSPQAAVAENKVVAVQSPADVGGAVEVGHDSIDNSLPVIVETISSKPTDLGSVTGGLVSGTLASAVAAVTTTVDRVQLAEVARPSAAVPAPVAGGTSSSAPTSSAPSVGSPATSVPTAPAPVVEAPSAPAPPAPTPTPVAEVPATPAPATQAPTSPAPAGEVSPSPAPSSDAGADKAAADKAAADKANADKAAADKAAADKAAADKAASDKAASDKVAADKAASDKAAADKAAADKDAADKADAEKAAKDKAGAEQAAKDKADAEKAAADKAAAKKAAADKAAAEAAGGKDNNAKPDEGSGKDSPADNDNGKGNDNKPDATDKPGKDAPNPDAADKPGKDEAKPDNGGLLDPLKNLPGVVKDVVDGVKDVITPGKDMPKPDAKP